MFVFVQKIVFIFHLFFKILQRYWEIALFGTLGISIHAHQKQQYHVVRNYDVYSQPENQLDLSKNPAI